MAGPSSVNPRHRGVMPTLLRGRPGPAPELMHAEGDDWRVLAAARAGDEAAVGRICDRHGAAVFVLACVMSSEREFAQTVTVDVLAEACTSPANPADAPRMTGQRGSLRRDLARRVYHRCAPPARDLTTRLAGAPGGHPSPLVAELALLAFQQRTAIALTCLGDHHFRDVGVLMGLATTTTAELIASGLHQLHQLHELQDLRDLQDLLGPDGTPSPRPSTLPDGQAGRRA